MANPKNKQELMASIIDGYAKLCEQIAKMSDEEKAEPFDFAADLKKSGVRWQYDQFTYVPKDEDDLTPRQRENIPLEELQETWMARMGENCVFISAKKQQNIDGLKRLLYNKAKAVHTARFPYNDFLYQTYDDLTPEE